MIIDRREVLNLLESFVIGGSGVIIGAPGVGKTYLLTRLCQQLLWQGTPFFLLPIDKLGDGSQEVLHTELNYSGDLITKLLDEVKNHPHKAGVLIFDAFDAARGEEVQQRFLSLVDRATHELRGVWNTIVTIRTYDARKSQDLLDLFGKPLETDPVTNREADIPCRHFLIPILTDNELDQVFDQIPNSRDLWRTASAEFQQLLRTPFNLWLLEGILADSSALDTSRVMSDIQLLGLFWDRRIRRRRDSEDREHILTQVTNHMVEEHSISVRKDAVYEPTLREAWNGLLSDQILIDASTTGRRVAFSHNILFDYAVSILLLGDEPDSLASFIVQDASRPLFLRPSLVYYLTRLWYIIPAVFWDTFWYLLSSQDGRLRLSARLLPATVVVNESYRPEQLNPALEAVAQHKPLGGQVLKLILDARRACQIERDDLWASVLDIASENLRPEYAWELATTTAEILKHQTDPNSDIVKVCGRISRRLLRWIWTQRQERARRWSDSLGAVWTVPLVAKTYGTDPADSRALLEKVLALTQEPEFPIEFIFRLTNDIDSIWMNDPDFAATVYEAVFSYSETSRKETPFGGPVVPMFSNRQQDYEMCQYHLVDVFSAFIRTSPVQASRAAIRCLNRYVVQKHIADHRLDSKSKSLPQPFQFRGGTSSYVRDMSGVWASIGGLQRRDEPMTMAQHMFATMREMASSADRLVELDSLLNLFRDNAQVAFLWTGLLKTGASAPIVFAPRLFELCIALPVLDGYDTRYALGEFIEAAASTFTADQLRRVEEAIVALPSSAAETKDVEELESLRNRLLARIPADLVRSDAAKSLLKQMIDAGKLPANEPLVQMGEGVIEVTDHEWEPGVDAHRDSPRNHILEDLLAPIDSFISLWQNNHPSPDSMKQTLPGIVDLYETLSQEPDLETTAASTAWTKLAISSKLLARSADDLLPEQFTFCRSVLMTCAQHELPRATEEDETEFARAPGWASAPRIEAIEGLALLAHTNPDTDILAMIEVLCYDLVPAVRFVAIGNLALLYDNSNTTFWQLVAAIAIRENNTAVLSALVRTLGRVVHLAPSETASVLSKISGKAYTSAAGLDLLDSFVSVVIGLYLVDGDTWAASTSDEWLARPVDFGSALQRAALDAVSCITPLRVGKEKSRQLAGHASRWLLKAIEAAARGLEETIPPKGNVWTEEQRVKLRPVYGVIDEVVSRLYFATTSDQQDSAKEKGYSEEQLKGFYFFAEPLLRQVLDVVQDKGLLFAPTAHYFMELLNTLLKCDPVGVLHLAVRAAKSSEANGYSLDPLAIREVVKLVEVILADHRILIRQDLALQDLLDLLDIFGNAGWPEALRLVWRLDEVFR